MPGVIDTAVGYEGGDLEHPTYKEVCTDRTGHAEVVEVTFDPSRVSYETLLDAFFALHDPTQVNRQGPDWGSQYRSVIFSALDEQTQQAKAKIAELNATGAYRKPIATKVEPATNVLEGGGVSPALPGEARHGALPHLDCGSRKQKAAVRGMPRACASSFAVLVIEPLRDAARRGVLVREGAFRVKPADVSICRMFRCVNL